MRRPRTYSVGVNHQTAFFITPLSMITYKSIIEEREDVELDTVGVEGGGEEGGESILEVGVRGTAVAEEEGGRGGGKRRGGTLRVSAGWGRG